jgi:hypothetical protein
VLNNFFYNTAHNQFLDVTFLKLWAITTKTAVTFFAEFRSITTEYTFLQLTATLVSMLYFSRGIKKLSVSIKF